MKFKSGQYVFINVPASSLWEWHPFSLVPSMDGKADFDLYIESKTKGWTEKLVHEATMICDGANENVLQVKIDGPIGGPMRAILDYKVVVLVGGNVGIADRRSLPAAAALDVHKRQSSFSLIANAYNHFAHS